MLGRMQPDFFPRVFGPRGDQPLDAEVVRGAFAELAHEITTATGVRAHARGGRRRASSRSRSTTWPTRSRRSRCSAGTTSPSTRSCCFGGAGGQHACAVADALGIDARVHPPARRRALGLRHGAGRHARACASRRSSAPLDDARRRRSWRRRWTRSARRRAPSCTPRACPSRADRGRGAGAPALRRHRHRARGADGGRRGHARRVRGRAPRALRLHDAGPARWSSRRSRSRGSADGSGGRDRSRPGRPAGDRQPAAPGDDGPAVHRRRVARGRVYTRDGAAARRRASPARRSSPRPTPPPCVEPGWQADGDAARPPAAGPRRAAGASRRPSAPTADPVLLEIFNNLFMSIAEQMGVGCRAPRYSVNIKERLDFSCALFDARRRRWSPTRRTCRCTWARWASSVRTIIALTAAGMKPGDGLRAQRPLQRRHAPARHHRRHAGVRRAGRTSLFFVASRGHHADIGGITPGSMPPDSTHGRRGRRAVRQLPAGRGRPAARGGDCCELLRSGACPARNPRPERRRPAGPGRGQRRRACDELAQDGGRTSAWTSCGPTWATSRTTPRKRCGACIDALHGRGVRLRARRRRDDRGRDLGRPAARTRRRSTSPAPRRSSRRNFNAPAAVCTRGRALRLPHAGRRRHPAERGLPGADRHRHPRRLDARRRAIPAAVVRRQRRDLAGGHRRAVRRARACWPAAQGTMNNFTFGNARHQYYETICGGSGAGPGFDGTDVRADPHDQLAAHRSRGARVALPGAARELRDPPRLAAARDATAAATARVRRMRFPGADDGQRSCPTTAGCRPSAWAAAGPAPLGRPVDRARHGGGRELEGRCRAELGAGDVFVVQTPSGGGFGHA